MKQSRWLLILQSVSDVEHELPHFVLWLANLDHGSQPRCLSTLEDLLEVLIADWRERGSIPLADRPGDPPSNSLEA